MTTVVFSPRLSRRNFTPFKGLIGTSETTSLDPDCLTAKVQLQADQIRARGGGCSALVRHFCVSVTECTSLTRHFAAEGAEGAGFCSTMVPSNAILRSLTLT